MKTALIALVVLSIAALLVLFFMSFKLLRSAQKQAALERQNQRKEYQIHPELAKEQQKLDEMKKRLQQKNKKG
nr:hypothetical protein [Acinetobacter sp. Marseille-Q1620]